MKKLIAKRPIQYLGRTYGPGDTLPAYDGRMVAAWVRAGTAAWSDTETEQAERRATAGIQDTNNALAVGVLNAMGVEIANENGVFVGAVKMEELIVAAIRERAKEGAENPGGQEPGVNEDTTQNGQENTEEGKADQEDGEPELVTGHLDAAQLESMTKAELLDLADKLGMDLSGATNNKERAARIAAAHVQAPGEEPGAAQ